MKAVTPPTTYRKALLLPVLCSLLAGWTLKADDFFPIEFTGLNQAPPPAPPMISAPPGKFPKGDGPLDGPGPTLYSIGQPTAEEQLYLELVNRSRSNPTAEGVRLANITDADVKNAYSFFSVNLALMQNAFSTNPPVPPLAMNLQLMTAARLHSGDMFTNKFQGHTGTDGSTLGPRLTAAGYPFQNGAENVYSSAKYVLHGHVGFNVDWGTGPGGMQDPPGHRNNIHSPIFREVGMGIVNGTNGGFGPQFITQDFGVRQGDTPLLTGVAYYDLNGNSFYDIGEGIGGVTVSVSNSTYYAVTADSGGYTVPVTTNGAYTVAFTAPGLATQRVVTVSSLNNLKLDYSPVYMPPVISGPNPAGLNVSNGYSFTPVGAAASYEYRYSLLSPYSLIEGAENGLSNVIATTSAGYSPITNGIVATGTRSFHLAHSTPTLQSLTLKATIRPSSTSQLSFAKRLGWATTNQIARAQISTNNGISWVNLWGKAGTGTSGETSFTTTNISLAPYAGHFSQVRFRYEVGAGSYFSQTDAGVGLYLDNIAITAADQASGFVTNAVGSGNSFALTPTATNSLVLNVRARLSGSLLEWGPALTVPVIVPPPSLQLQPPIITGTQVQIEFAVVNYRSGMTFQLWKSASPSGPWSVDSSATLSTLVAGAKYRATTSTAGGSGWFYRVRGTY
jgi:hypothetical protein